MGGWLGERLLRLMPIQRPCMQLVSVEAAQALTTSTRSLAAPPGPAVGSCALLALHAVLLLVVLVNMLIAIVSDTFKEVKRWAAAGLGVLCGAVRCAGVLIV